MRDMKKLYIAERRQRLAAGAIDRRQFVTGLLAAGVALPAAVSMAGEALAATPKRGGSYVQGVGHGSTTDSLDPATYENGFMVNLALTTGGALTEVDKDGTLRGDLAQSYESDDALTWRFKLVPGVEFHDGKSLTPDDVIASMNHHRGDDSKSAAKGILKPVKDIRADGDTVVFELETPNADFPFLVSDYHLVVLPAQDGKIDPTSTVRTGAYTIERFEPGVRLEGRKFANDHRGDERGYFDEVTQLSIVDATARQNALMSGDVMAIDRVDPKIVALLARNPNIEILERESTLHYTFPMRVDADPFTSMDLRNAIKLAVKRQELVDKILVGRGTMGNDHPISPANQFHADLEQREFDPEAAAALYRKSGHSGPIVLRTSEAAFAGAVDAAQLIAASAKEAGIPVEVKREPKDGYWSNVWNKEPWCACYWGGRPTEDWMFSSAYTNDTEWNDTAWKGTPESDKFNELVIAARAELKPEVRATIYADAQRMIRDFGGALVPMFANHVMGVAKGVAHGPDVAANWEMDGGKSMERWWMS